MMIYQEALLEQIQDTRHFVDSLANRFEHNTFSGWENDIAAITARFDQLKTYLPDNKPLGEWGRKIHFLDYYLKRNEPENCQSDVHELSSYLDGAEESVKKKLSSVVVLDETLRKRVIGLLKQGDFTSAIRKAFVLLSERIRGSHSELKHLDGSDLINKIYSKGSTYFPSMPADIRQARRDLLAGAYAVFRNPAAHGEPETSVAECDAAISLVNFCLSMIALDQ